MKKRLDSKSGRVCLVLCIFLSVLSIWILNVTTTFATKGQGITRGSLKKKTKWDPLLWQFPLGGQISCDRTHLRYDLCSINGSTVLEPTVSTFFIVGPTKATLPTLVEKVKPYPRKFENFIMAQIKDLTLTSGPPSPPCEVQHNSPALVFSVGGYTGNFFHDFNDGFIPLFITVNSIFPHRDFVIVVSEAPDWWISKYKDLLNIFSEHPIITIKNDIATHCFPSATLGLISHGFMTINQTLIPNSKTFIHFRGLLDKAFGQNIPRKFYPPESRPRPRPRLVLASRNGSIGRVIMNLDEVTEEMEKVGFDVVVFEPTGNTSLHESYALVNSSHAMVGVHGAALTNSLFLRPGSVLMQVVPIGAEWAAGVYFGRVARGLNLEYMEYRIGVEETSLVEKYGKDNLLLKDPHALQSTGWPIEIMDIYLKEQNVKLDLDRLRGYLEKAYEKAKKFMDREG